MAKATASEVAKYILLYCVDKNGESVSNLKLQKLLYYTQAYHLAIFDTPLFADRLEAWIHGPVVPSVFTEYRQHRWRPVPLPLDRVELDTGIVEHIADVIEAYGHLSANELERLSHKESPWLEARCGIGLDLPSNAVISTQTMQTFYKPLLLTNAS